MPCERLVSLGRVIPVARFWNEQVNTEMENVLEAICAAQTDS